jgi:hypothetical protein
MQVEIKVDEKTQQIVFIKVVFPDMRNKERSILQNVEWLLEEATNWKWMYSVSKIEYFQWNYNLEQDFRMKNLHTNWGILSKRGIIYVLWYNRSNGYAWY